ncbi:MAG TPA: FAD-binding oxidoreductase [Vicinamibacterales bacterium]|nr:FAD-binding oxidoreductase [Vicinamibacterales bacterium]
MGAASERPAVKEQPYWWDTIQSQAASLKSQVPSERVDVAIVGAGYTGLAAARHLARAGARVVVLEREHVGWGASSRNGGQVLTGLKLDPSTLVARFGEARARELFGVGAAAIDRLEALVAEESIDCEYEHSGHLQAAWKPSHFDAFRDEQQLLARVFDHRVHLVSRSEQRSELGSDRYHGVMIDERSCAINPARYVYGLAAAACRAGAAIVSGAAVTRLERQPVGWRLVSSAGTVEARDVLAATNGYTNGAAPGLRRRLIPIGSYIIATEPLDQSTADALLPRRRMAFDSKNFLYYFRVTDDRRLLFGGRAEFGRPDPESTRRAAGILRRGMVDVFPGLARAGIEYAWGGNVAFTRDQMPHAGLLDGMYYAGGYCGHGVAMATYLGEQIARRIAGEPIAHPFFDDAFEPIPMYSGTPWFLPLVGAYYQVKDWLQ